MSENPGLFVGIHGICRWTEMPSLDAGACRHGRITPRIRLHIRVENLNDAVLTGNRQSVRLSSCIAKSRCRS